VGDVGPSPTSLTFFCKLAPRTATICLSMDLSGVQDAAIRPALQQALEEPLSSWTP